ncbi:MAG: phytanoyl-CoA dioxygenase family protein [Actinomycetota bacterium]|nr:phytanoyl-CoA dioxygenase family protein [Actinomycetota bacterium]MDP2287426.1 phytanoyl-CoA dioxygenase family protein [Actinomycetota bacterium]
MSELVESTLRLPRLARTVIAARSFTRAAQAPPATAGQQQFNMRSSMDIHPRIGKLISRSVVRGTPADAWQIANPHSSRFLDAAEVESAVQGIRRDGFYVFGRIVPTEITTAIREYAEQAPAIARGADQPAGIYPRKQPLVGRYDIEETVALQCAEVQEFVTDPVAALISQRYLNQPVLMDEVAFWWTTTQGTADTNINAQMFHQDRDRLSFLKFFIYLTDVRPDTGPHVYLRGSHRHIPRSLRADGRISDESVRTAGLWDAVTELTGPAGTVMAVDTIGLHKGKTPTGGDRLALESEFCTTLFGNDYERPDFPASELTQHRFQAMPWVLQRYAQSAAVER